MYVNKVDITDKEKEGMELTVHLMWKPINAFVILMVMLAGCSAGSSPARVGTETQAVPLATISASLTPSIVASDLPMPPTVTQAAATPQAATQTLGTTPTAVTLRLCSPLQDLTIADLFTIVTTPFNPPPTGQDSGHQGVDFAYYRHGTHTQMLGLPVYAALTGRVAAAILDRPPYGNLVIVETRLDSLPADLLQRLAVTPAPTLAVPDTRLTCPPRSPHPEWDAGQPSLYLLYAHLENPPLVKVGDTVACGGQLGEVGNTGESGNPHLHLETRLGPSGASFASMAHYIDNATLEEMDNYCTWRTSGIFQMFDPLTLLALGKN